MANEQAKKTNWMPIVLGILLLICGIGIYAWPGLTLVVIAVWGGIAFLVAGITELAAYLTKRDGRPRTGWMLASAIIDIIAGLVMIAHPVAFAPALPWLIGALFVVLGIIEVAGGSQVNKLVGFSPIPMYLSGVLRILCGILFLVWPASFAIYIALFTIFRGVALIVEGVMGR